MLLTDDKPDHQVRNRLFALPDRCQTREDTVADAKHDSRKANSQAVRNGNKRGNKWGLDTVGNKRGLQSYHRPVLVVPKPVKFFFFSSSQ